MQTHTTHNTSHVTIAIQYNTNNTNPTPQPPNTPHKPTHQPGTLLCTTIILRHIQTICLASRPRQAPAKPIILITPPIPQHPFTPNPICLSLIPHPSIPQTHPFTPIPPSPKWRDISPPPTSAQHPSAKPRPPWPPWLPNSFMRGRDGGNGGVVSGEGWGGGWFEVCGEVGGLGGYCGIGYVEGWGLGEAWWVEGSREGLVWWHGGMVVWHVC
ncbi:hypothetical protein IAQ61_001434 [Plenodomus lingam]|uniref:uncharacterized protein n=1 Tax=Leptosphaeria maculans TaxID=5022 RepID=UPI00332AD60F|nr:hypothetical protein IAQ61_001434 [Plenodomus lingam]